jgi:anti-sigma-K factor RskA
MSVHEQFAEDLALYALGALVGPEKEALEQHLEVCSPCQNELRQLQSDATLLALSTIGPVPPPLSRKRLLRAIARERRAPVAVPRGFAWRLLVPYAVSATLIVVAAFMWNESRSLNRVLADLRQRQSEMEKQLRVAQELVNTLTSPESKQITLAPVKAMPQPQGKAYYLSSNGHLIFLANNLAPLPAGKVYELWLIPPSGSPIPAGLFQPDSRGTATVVDPPLPRGIEAKAFAITIEPTGGSPAPTSQPIMLGAAG